MDFEKMTAVDQNLNHLRETNAATIPGAQYSLE